MDCFFYPHAGLGLYFWFCSAKRGGPPGTIVPALILEVLNLQHDSRLGECTLVLRENQQRNRAMGDVRNGNRELKKRKGGRGSELIPL